MNLSENGAELGGYHPLFLPEDGQSKEDFKPEPIALIQVERIEGGGQKIKIPERFSAYGPEGLTDETALFARFGGGTFRLTARRDTGDIYAKRQITIAGAPRIYGQLPGIPQQAQPPASPASPFGAGGGQDLFALLLQMQNQNAERSRSEMLTMMQAQMQQQERSSQQMTQVLVAVLGGQQQGSIASTNAMSGLMTTLLQQKSPNPNVDMVKTTSDMLDLAKKIAPDGGGSQWSPEMIGGLIGGLGMLLAQLKNGGVPPGAPMPGPPAPQTNQNGVIVEQPAQQPMQPVALAGPNGAAQG